MNIEIANRLVTLRRKHGFSQEELAAKLGISRQAVSKWERAESSPDTDNLIALAALYQISLDALLQSDAESTQNELYAAQLRTETERPKNGAEPAARKKRLLGFPYPALVTIIYLALGFGGGWWHPAWVLFLTIPIYYAVSRYLDQ
jgi:transcriptional regulator with XRE-family HTH domain